jgi:hypothetical protein
MGLLKNISKSVSKTVSKGVNFAKSDIFPKEKDKSLSSKLSSIAEKNEQMLTKTPEEIRNDKLKELNDKLIATRSNYENAPKALSDAEKEYYIFKDGINEYNAEQLIKYTKEADVLKTDMLAKHDQEMNNAFQSMAYYDSQRTFITNINEIKLNILSKIKHKLQEIRNEYTDKNTNDRKTYYIIQQQETISLWLQILNHSMIAFAIVYVLYCVRENNINLFTYIFPIVVLIIVFYLELIIKLIQSIPLSMNVYASWGENNTNSMPILISVIGLSVILYFIIKLNNSKIDNYFNS